MIPKVLLCRALLFGCLLLAGRSIIWGAKPEDMIQQVLQQQAEAWNRGDLNEFVASYAQDCTFVGSTIAATSRQQVLEHYRQKYPSADAMGELACSGIVVHVLDDRVATVTGYWHLQRKNAAGGPVGGLFSLVWKLLDGKWQIVLDHTS